MDRTWLSLLARYLAAVFVLNLVWEAGHMPLYDLWSTGTIWQILLYGAHCTIGDVLIALSALVAALVLSGTAEWPATRYGRVAGIAVLRGLA